MDIILQKPLFFVDDKIITFKTVKINNLMFDQTGHVYLKILNR